MKTHKPLSSKKPPKPDSNHQIIEAWIANAKPSLGPILAELDNQIRAQLDDPRYAIKWGKAYYGAPAQGWCVELVAYDVSVNIVFLNGGRLTPPPALGDETRYVKVKTIEELEAAQIHEWIEQSCNMSGWQW